MSGTENGTQGMWTVHGYSEQSKRIAAKGRIEWSHAAALDKQTKFVALDVTENALGWKPNGFVLYSRKEQSVSVLIDKVTEDKSEVEIKWDAKTTAGSMLHEDGAKACWDTEKNNVACL
ncbi:MAG TPA: hypothetical protein VE954_11475 [Oligoflexus sp.]|uniref:hypothetical protein n=1 Tax=Oligoflexus sp. TaxID=1971216 RepID=UPI002D4D7C17|nr:hypothetical protein [Oligoflexus sp.]HYX33724.1 hypothetical protein [Oligoflexus sp.]